MIITANQMEYLVRFVQVHESFRKPEVEALAALANFDVDFLDYSECVCSSISTITKIHFSYFGFIDKSSTMYLIPPCLTQSVVALLRSQTSK